MHVDASRAALAAAGLSTDALTEAEALAADPSAALRTLARLAERDPLVLRGGPGHELVRRVGAVAGASDALGDLLAQSAAAVAVLAGELDPQDHATVRATCLDALDGADDPARELARVQKLGLLRIAARDLLGMARTPAIAEELADLAQGVLAAALDRVAGDVGGPKRVAVIAMGKLGGRELNYVSDVDVMFVHDGDFAAAAKLCERYLRLLSTVSPEGRAYEVDANLRPEGKDGPLSRSLEGFAAYYERWAKNWEFQALLKARPIAGDEDLGREFLALIEPHVWPDRRSAQAIAEIQAMKTVVEESPAVRREGERQVKLAPGGLRDIEFAVQLLQLVHGRHDPALRSPQTLTGLAALARGGYVGEEDAQVFDEAYQFLRTVEHRLQLVRLRRTHTVPEDAEERRRLARAMGFRDAKDAGALERFDREHTRVRGVVRRLHEKLFYRPLLERFAELGADEALPLGEGGLAEEAARERLEALGFRNPTAALGHLDALAGGVSRRAPLFRTLLPAILPTLAEQPDPDGGLAAFRSLADRLRDSPFFLRTLRDNPPVGELLAQALGRSKLVGQWLERQPEVFGLLGDPQGLARALEPGEYRRLADGLLRRKQDQAAGADALRRMRRREAVRIAVRDLTGQADSVDVVKELSGLAQACLEAGLQLALDGHGDRVRMTVIGMGKLGGAELGYASDLDILLVYDGERELALAAASRLLKLLGDITPEGKAFVVDPNLRPEGKDGPLARSLESYAAYYERWAEPWELQSLTQARPVAGDPELGYRFMELIAPHVYPAEATAARLQAIRVMKARIERERAGRGGAPARMATRVDVKLGPGGLSDIEWLVQLQQVKHGATQPLLRVPGALAGVEALEALSLLTEEEADWLRDGLRLLWRVRNALYLGGFPDTQTLPANPEDQQRLARMLGWPRLGTQDFLEEVTRTMRRVRRVHERGFYDA